MHPLFESMQVSVDMKFIKNASLFIGVKMPGKDAMASLMLLDKPINRDEFEKAWAALLEEIIAIMSEWIVPSKIT